MRTLLVCIFAALLCSCATGPAVDRAEAARALAPAGKLRAAINYGNSVLAQRGPDGQPRGVSADLARELARELGVPLDYVTYTAAGQVTDAATKNAWDVAFVAIDPKRAQDIDFTGPYVLIEGGYIVAARSVLRSIVEVDRPGARVGVGAKSAYDLYLTRTLKHAELVRVPTPEAFRLIESGKVEILAGVKPPLVEYARTHPGVRVIEGRFMVIEQAMAVAKGRGAGYAYVKDFVERMKASGFVADALKRSNQPDAAVAPPAR